MYWKTLQNDFFRKSKVKFLNICFCSIFNVQSKMVSRVRAELQKFVLFYNIYSFINRYNSYLQKVKIVVNLNECYSGRVTVYLGSE